MVRRSCWPWILAALTLVALPPRDASAQHCALDPGFGTAGSLSTPAGRVAAVATQGDGKVLIAGTAGATWNGTAFGPGTGVVVTRHLSNGALDPAFGNDGRATLPIGSGGVQVNAMAIDNNGRVVVAGSWREGAAQQVALLVRFTAGGEVDGNFGGDAIVTLDASSDSDDDIAALAIDGSNRVVAGGTATWLGARSTAVDRSDVFVARFDDTGGLDSTFNGSGVLVRNLQPSGAPAEHAAAILIQNGRIVLSGHTGTGPSLGFRGGFIIGLTTTGTPDSTFASFGSVPTAAAHVYDLAVQGDGKLLYTTGVDFGVVILARLTGTGGIDGSFNSGGANTMPIPDAYRGADAKPGPSVSILPDGRIVLASRLVAREGGGSALFLARYSAGGTFDASVPTDGRATQGADYPDQLVIAAGIDGDTYGATTTLDGSTPAFRLLRFVTKGTCGNGIPEGCETCDDANGAANDGCTAACAVEAGWVCNGSCTPAPSTTTSTTSTSTTTGGATTSTTIPGCVESVCRAERALTSTECASSKVPSGVATRLRRGASLADRAVAAPERPRLAKRARTTLQGAARGAERASQRRNPKVTTNCAGVISTTATGLIDRISR